MICKCYSSRAYMHGYYAIVHKCTILPKLICVFFEPKCVKRLSFSILHKFTQPDVISLRLAFWIFYVYVDGFCIRRICTFFGAFYNTINDVKYSLYLYCRGRESTSKSEMICISLEIFFGSWDWAAIAKASTSLL